MSVRRKGEEEGEEENTTKTENQRGEYLLLLWGRWRRLRGDIARLLTGWIFDMSSEEISSKGTIVVLPSRRAWAMSIS